MIMFKIYSQLKVLIHVQTPKVNIFCAKGLEWTNFKTCAVVNKHLTQEKVHMVLYIISVVALMPAIIIFFAYK